MRMNKVTGEAMPLPNNQPSKGPNRLLPSIPQKNTQTVKPPPTKVPGATHQARRQALKGVLNATDQSRVNQAKALFHKEVQQLRSCGNEEQLRKALTRLNNVISDLTLEGLHFDVLHNSDTRQSLKELSNKLTGMAKTIGKNCNIEALVTENGKTILAALEIAACAPLLTVDLEEAVHEVQKDSSFNKRIEVAVNTCSAMYTKRSRSEDTFVYDLEMLPTAKSLLYTTLISEQLNRLNDKASLEINKESVEEAKKLEIKGDFQTIADLSQQGKLSLGDLLALNELNMTLLIYEKKETASSTAQELTTALSSKNLLDQIPFASLPSLSLMMARLSSLELEKKALIYKELSTSEIFTSGPRREILKQLETELIDSSRLITLGALNNAPTPVVATLYTLFANYPNLTGEQQRAMNFLATLSHESN